MSILLGRKVEAWCGNGGRIRMIDDSEHPVFGMENGWAFWRGDLFLNSYNDMTLDVTGNYDVEATVQHITGDPVMRFDLTSRKPNGKTDIKVEGLKPNAPYRVLFDGVLAKCSTGRAHAQTDENGMLQFNEVVIPDV